MDFYRNGEYYADPTAGEAISNIMRKNRSGSAGTGERKNLTGWDDLTQAIILQAVDEYRKALRRIQVFPRQQKLQAAIRDVEDFFRSRWFAQITSIDGEMLIRRLREEIG